MPGIFKFESDEYDELKIKKLDRFAVRQNIFFQYLGGNSKDESVIVPFEIEINFLAALRQGIGSRFGPTQELASKWLHPFKIEMKKCQKVNS